MREGRSVEIYGKAGIGKSTILEYLAHHEITRDFPDGVVYLKMPWFQSVSDLLQELLYRFYERSAWVILTKPEIDSFLGSKKALILLDDVKLSREQVRELLNSRRGNFTFAFASKKKRLERKYFIPLKTFSLDDALDLVRHELSLSKKRYLPPEERDTIERGEKRWKDFLTDEERQHATTLWEVLQDSPKQIRREVSKVTEKECSLADIARQVKSTPSVVALVKRMLEAMPEPARRFLLVLAAVQGVALLPDRADAITASLGADSSSLGGIQPHLESLLDENFIEATGDRYRIASDLSEILEQEYDLTPWRESALEYFTAWARQHQAVPSHLMAESDAIMQSLEWAVETHRWQQVLELGRIVDSGFCLSGQWGAWEQALDWQFQAARTLEDWDATAWVLHQKGSRALCLGNNDIAYTCLTQALGLRESLSDRPGAALTRHNLELMLRPEEPERQQSHLLPPLLAGFVGALILSLWPLYRFPNPVTSSLSVQSSPPIPESACIVRGLGEILITRSGNSFRGDIPYLLNGEQKFASVSGGLVEDSGWFSMNSVNPEPDTCFITFDGEQLPDGSIVGGVSADEVLTDGQVIKTDKSEEASGIFKMISPTPRQRQTNTWTLIIPALEQESILTNKCSGSGFASGDCSTGKGNATNQADTTTNATPEAINRPDPARSPDNPSNASDNATNQTDTTTNATPEAVNRPDTPQSQDAPSNVSEPEKVQPGSNEVETTPASERDRINLQDSSAPERRDNNTGVTPETE